MRRLLPALMVCSCAAGPYYAELGARAPRFRADTLNAAWSRVDGVDLEAALASNDAVLLAFGASYCGPCMIEWPVLRDLAAEYRPLGLLVIFVTLDRDPAGLEAIEVLATRHLGISSPLIADSDGELARRYRVEQLPQLYLIDKSGQVVWRTIGYRGSTIDELVPQLEQVLASVSGRSDRRAE